MPTETFQTPIVTKPFEGDRVRFYADEFEIKARTEMLDVAVTTAHAGCEPPMHIHDREDEAIYVLDGRVTFHLGDEAIAGEAGTHVFLPRGVPHTFSVNSGTARMLVTATPSGFLDMFDAILDAFGGEMPPVPAPEHGPMLGGVLAEFGISIVGPNPATR